MLSRFAQRSFQQQSRRQFSSQATTKQDSGVLVVDDRIFPEAGSLTIFLPLASLFAASFMYDRSVQQNHTQLFQAFTTVQDHKIETGLLKTDGSLKKKDFRHY